MRPGARELYKARVVLETNDGRPERSKKARTRHPAFSVNLRVPLLWVTSCYLDRQSHLDGSKLQPLIGAPSLSSSVLKLQRQSYRVLCVPVATERDFINEGNLMIWLT